MKKLTCTTCGSIDINKSGDIYVCQTCGSRFSSEEVKKLTIDGKVDVSGSVKIDRTGELIPLIDLASAAAKSRNWSAAEAYANEILAIQPNISYAWAIKGSAVGWQSTIANNRLKEAVLCYCKALENCVSVQECEFAQSMINSQYTRLVEAMHDSMLDYFNKYTSNDVPKLFLEFEIAVWNSNVELAKNRAVANAKFKLEKEKTIEIKTANVENLRLKRLEVIKKLWTRKWKEYYQENDWHPSEYDFSEMSKECTSIYLVAKNCIVGQTVHDEDEITVSCKACEFIISELPKYADLKAYRYGSTGYFVSKSWTNEYKQTIETWRTDAKSEIQRITSSYYSNNKDVDYKKLDKLISQRIYEEEILTVDALFNALVKINPNSMVGNLGKALTNACISGNVDNLTRDLDRARILNNAVDDTATFDETLYALFSMDISLNWKYLARSKYTVLHYICEIANKNLFDWIDGMFDEEGGMWNDVLTSSGATPFAYLSARKKSQSCINDARYIAKTLLIDYGIDIRNSKRPVYSGNTDKEIAQMILSKYPDIQKAGGCYVATCVYGSYDCPQVWTLRRYRDDTLGSTWYGRLFIRTYYAISPTLVKWFGETNWFKKLWKGKLDRIVAKLQAEGVKDTPYEDKNW